MRELKRILHAEDDPDIREITKLSLELIGEFELLQCHDGLEVVSKADAFRPDLFLMDVMMPSMDGPEAIETLRRQCRFETTPVVFVTARASNQEVGELERKFSARVITKPFDPVLLPVELRELWSKLT